MGEPRGLDIREVRFVKGAVKPEQLPTEPMPELVVAGRSNVGKSSLLRALFGSKKLVRVSKTPGRTREMNAFEVVLRDGSTFRVVDLPGYGYAKVSRSIREEWGRFITRYIETRDQISMVFVLVDARRMLDRGLDDMELGFLEWLEGLGRRHVLVFTKVDKVPKTKWGVLESTAARQVGRKVRSVLFSSTSLHGLDDLARVITSMVRSGKSS